MRFDEKAIVERNVPCTLRFRNLKTQVYALITHQMFSVHNAPEKFENATITAVIFDLCWSKIRTQVIW